MTIIVSLVRQLVSVLSRVGLRVPASKVCGNTLRARGKSVQTALYHCASRNPIWGDRPQEAGKKWLGKGITAKRPTNNLSWRPPTIGHELYCQKKRGSHTAPPE